MKSISVSDYLHKWIMDHKDSEHKSADEVILGVINQNSGLTKTIDNLLERINEMEELK